MKIIEYIIFYVLFKDLNILEEISSYMNERESFSIKFDK